MISGIFSLQLLNFLLFCITRQCRSLLSFLESTYRQLPLNILLILIERNGLMCCHQNSAISWLCRCSMPRSLGFHSRQLTQSLRTRLRTFLKTKLAFRQEIISIICNAVSNMHGGKNYGRIFLYLKLHV